MIWKVCKRCVQTASPRSPAPSTTWCFQTTSSSRWKHRLTKFHCLGSWYIQGDPTEMSVFSWPEQLNRWPCPLLCLLGTTNNKRVYNTTTSDPRDLWLEKFMTIFNGNIWWQIFYNNFLWQLLMTISNDNFLWQFLTTISDDHFWWQFLMTISDDNSWWQFLITIFDDNFWW